MVGRGVDQILPKPGDPRLREAYVGDARQYVDLAERTNGPIPRPVDPTWPWGEALEVLEAAAPHARVINLETAVTRSDAFAPDKAIHYRMHPDNMACLTVARPDVCVLANNHSLDFGPTGLVETLEVLGAARLHVAGAGRDVHAAWRPAAVPLPDGGRVLVLAMGDATSGIPAPWAATGDRPGVAYVARPSPGVAADVVDKAQALRRPGDVVVVSIHWGSNWGYEVTPAQRRFAHALIDGGVDVIHGHSSHHPRPIEVYRGRLILYGCGDLIDDYEGIAGYEAYRDDLRLLYLADLDHDTGVLQELRMIPLAVRRMRLEHASQPDRTWLEDTLDRVSRPYGTRVTQGPEGQLVLRVEPAPR
jgi:poly-gamma-glutamate capsule biosynthesis protein CapA/YwtB (metallophosphatase superfamily)